MMAPFKIVHDMPTSTPLSFNRAEYYNTTKITVSKSQFLCQILNKILSNSILLTYIKLVLFWNEFQAAFVIWPFLSYNNKIIKPEFVIQRHADIFYIMHIYGTNQWTLFVSFPTETQLVMWPNLFEQMIKQIFKEINTFFKNNLAKMTI